MCISHEVDNVSCRGQSVHGGQSVHIDIRYTIAHSIVYSVVLYLSVMKSIVVRVVLILLYRLLGSSSVVS